MATTQEVQTSFRPSIKDSADFKKLSSSILKLSYDKDDYQNAILNGLTPKDSDPIRTLSNYHGDQTAGISPS